MGVGAESSAVAIAQPAARDVWEGVFTESQATRGQEAYSHACTVCHREDLSGNEDGAPPLRGPAFLQRWTDRSLSEFYFVLAETMPQEAPGSLTTREYVDIISFILKRNGASAGNVELTGETESLRRVVFTVRRPR